MEDFRPLRPAGVKKPTRLILSTLRVRIYEDNKRTNYICVVRKKVYLSKQYKTILCFNTELVTCFAFAGTGARASLGAVSVGVTASIGCYTLVHLCAGLTTALVPGLACAGWAGLLALFAFRTDCARAATTVFRVAVVNLITLDLAVSSKVSLTSARVSTGPGVAAQSLSVAVMLLVGVGAWSDRLARFAMDLETGFGFAEFAAVGTTEFTRNI